MLILASQSPRRQELLRNAGFSFEIRASGVEEVPQPHESAADYVTRLALDKALAIDASPDDFVIAADTTVILGETIMEKPLSAEDAVSMLTALSGQTHTVLTGVCVRHNGRTWTACESTQVHFVPISGEEIRAYVASGEPMDKAGAYGIQGLASKFVDRIEGCYFNIVGLPVARVYSLLREAGYSFPLG